VKLLFAEQIEVGTTVVDDFLVGECVERVKADGQPYYSMRLYDRTGSIKAVLWDLNGEPPPRNECFVHIGGKVTLYNKEPQLTISRYRVMEDSEVSLDDYLPVSKRDRDVMRQELRQEVWALEPGPIKEISLCLLADGEIGPLLRDAPAAKKLHHAWLGGLSEHILSLMGLAKVVCPRIDGIDQTLVLAGCLWHDIGKVKELSWRRAIGMTRSGRLTGHVGIGLQIFDQFRSVSAHVDCADFVHLEHIIASHHGRKEWGALQIPQSREAQLFHLLDMIDSGMAMMVAPGPVDADGFTKFNPALETCIYAPGLIEPI
jgi:3'-5' exoribonuclease